MCYEGTGKKHRSVKNGELFPTNFGIDYRTNREVHNINLLYSSVHLYDKLTGFTDYYILLGILNNEQMSFRNYYKIITDYYY